MQLVPDGILVAVAVAVDVEVGVDVTVLVGVGVAGCGSKIFATNASLKVVLEMPDPFVVGKFVEKV